MKTGLTRKRKVTEFYFNEHDDLAEIYSHKLVVFGLSTSLASQ